jgi:hypothetical protein
MAQIDDLNPLREVIRRHGLSAKKSLGQNFLLDLNLTTRIARTAEPLESVSPRCSGRSGHASLPTFRTTSPPRSW